MNNNYNSSDLGAYNAYQTFGVWPCKVTLQQSNTSFFRYLKVGFLFLLGIGVNFSAFAQSTGSYGPFCEMGPMETLVGTPAGGVWSSTHSDYDNTPGKSFSGTTTAIFAPTNLGDISSSQTVLVTYTVNSVSVSTNIIVNPNPEPAIGTPAFPTSVCENDADLTLIGSPVPSGTSRGVWTGSSVTDDPSLIDANAVFDPSGESGNIMVTYTYTDENNCSDIIMETIRVNSAGIESLTSGQEICKNASPIDLIPSVPLINGQTGIWSGPGVTNVSPFPNFPHDETTVTGIFDPSLVNGDATITYTFQDVSGGCTDIASVLVTVKEIPTVNTPQDITICSGEMFDALFFTGSTVPGTVYDWTAAVTTNSPADIGINSQGAGSIPAFEVNDVNAQTVVTVSITPTAIDCSLSPAETFTITVNPAPSITGTPTNRTTCGVTDGKIAIGGITGGPYSLSYKKDGVLTTDNSFDSPHEITGLSAGVYSEIQVNDGTCPSNALEDITIVDPTAPTVNAVTDYTLCVGETFDALTFTGSSNTTFNWMSDIAIPNGNGTNGTTITSFTPIAAEVGTYSVTVTPTENTTGCQGTPITFSITINPIPTVSLTGQTICAGEQFALIDFVSTPTGASFAWTNDNTSIGLGATGIGDIAAFTGQNNGITPVVANLSVTPTLAGCPGTATDFELTVNPIPTVADVEDISICVGESTNISFTHAAASNGEVGGVTYEWTNDNLAIGTNSTGNGNVSFTTTNSGNIPIEGNFTVTPTANGCEGTPIQFKVTVKPNPTIDPVTINDQMACPDEMTQAIAFTGSTVAGTVYKWEKVTPSGMPIGLNKNEGTGTLPSFTALNNTNGAISVDFEVVADADGCMSTPESFEITVNPKPTISNPTIVDPPANIDLFGTILCAGLEELSIEGTPTPGSGNTPPSFGLWSGPGISNVDGVAGTATLNVSDLAGTVTLTYEFTDANGCTSTKDFDIVVRNAQPSIPDLGPYCAQSGVQTFSGNPLPNLSIGQSAIWSIVAKAGATGSPSITNDNGMAEFDPVGLSGDFTLTYSFEDEFECIVSTNKDITVGSVEVIPGTYGPICENNGAIQLTGMPVPGVNQTSRWSGEGIVDYDASTGMANFDPVGLTGTAKVWYVFTSTMTGCTDSMYTDIVINPKPTVDAGTYSQVCEDAAIVNLVGSPNPSTTGFSGKWDGPNLSVIDDDTRGESDADFNPSGFNGPVSLTYTFVDDNGCSVTDTTEIQVNPVPVADAGPFDTLCEGSAPVMLTGSPVLKAEETGTWSGTGIIASSVDVKAGTAMFDPTGLSGNITLTYTFVNDKSCTDVATTQYTIQQLPNAVAGADQLVCESAMPITLTGSLLTADQTGEWSGSTGVIDGGDGDNIATFNPNGLLIGNANTVIELTYTVSDQHGCESTSTMEVTITPSPTVDAGTYDPVCANIIGNVMLKGSPNPSVDGGMGIWSSTSSDVNLTAAAPNFGTVEFDPSGLEGDYEFTYTYTDNNNCEVVDVTTVTIKHPDAGSYGPFCSNDDIVDLIGSPIPGADEKGEWSIVSGAPSNAIFDQSTIDAVAKFDPTGLSGAVVLRYTFTDKDNCQDSDEVTVMVNALPTINLLTYNDVCVDGNKVDLVGGPVPSAGTTGKWSSTGSGVVEVDEMNGIAKFDPSLAGEGTHILTYTYTDLNNCSNEMATTGATTTIIVNPLPTLTATGPATICVNSMGTLTGTPTGGNWSGNGVTTNNSGAGTAIVDASIAGVGPQTYTYTYTDGQSCENSATTEVEVLPLPIVDAGEDMTVCSNEGLVDLVGSPVPSDGQTGAWTVTSYVADTDMNDASAIFDPSSLTSGDYTVTYTFNDGNGCITSNSATITVITPPTVSILDKTSTTPTELCEESNAIILEGFPIPNGTDEEGNWTGDGITPSGIKDGKATFDPSGLNGSYTVRYTFIDDTGCEDYAEHTIEVLDLVADAGTYDPVCESATGTTLLTGSPLPAASSTETGVWSATGGGVVGSTIANTNGTATFDPTGLSGTITLTYTFTNADGCTATDNTTIEVTTPIIVLENYDPVCIGSDPIDLVGVPVPTGTATGAWSYMAGPSSGTPTDVLTDANTTDGAAIFDPTRVGNDTLQYTYTDINGCIGTAEIIIQVLELPTVEIFDGTTNNPAPTLIELCEESASKALSATPVPTALKETGTWSVDGTEVGTGANYSFDPAGRSGSYEVAYTFLDDSGCTATEIVTIEVYDLEVDAGTYGPACADPGNSIDLDNEIVTGAKAGEDTTITWSGDGVLSGPAFDPTSSMITGTSSELTVEVQQTLFTGGPTCIAEDKVTIEINNPTINLAAIDPVCLNSETVITGNPVPQAGEMGVWEIITDPVPISNVSMLVNDNPNTGEVTLMAGGVRTEELKYTFTDVNGCENSDSIEVIVNALPADPTTSGPTEVCENASNIEITATPAPTGDATGIWTSDNGGIVSQANGVVTFDPSGYDNESIILTYTYTDENGCVPMTQATHTINVTKITPTATADMTTVCASGSDVTLTGTPTANGTGVWTLPDNTVLAETSTNSGIAMFDPTGFSGDVELTYTFTEDANRADCIVSATTTVNVTATDIVLPDYGNVCKEGGLVTITGSPIPMIGETGIWTSSNNDTDFIIEDPDGGDGVAMIDASKIDVNLSLPADVTLIYTFTDINGCQSVGTKVVTVYEVPTAEIDLPATIGSICSESGIVTLSGATPLPTATNSTGIWSATGTGVTPTTISNNNDGTATLDPSGLSGSIDLIYTYTDDLSCSSADTTTINIGNTAITLMPVGLVCINETAVDLTATLPSGATGTGQWSGTGVSNSSSAGTFDASVAGYGTHEVTYTFTNDDGCVTTETMNITVLEPTIGSYGPVCIDNGFVTLTGSTFTGKTVDWTGDGVTDNDDGTATFDPATAGVGTHTLTYTLSGGDCDQDLTTTITVNELPTTGSTLADVDVPVEICESNSPITIAGIVIPVGGKGEWSGNGITDLNTSDEFASFDPSGLTGPVQLTYTLENAAGCVSEIDTVYNVTNIQVSAGTYQALCENSSPIVLSGTPAGGTWAGTGVSNINTVNGTATFNPSGRSGDVTISYTFNNGTCSDMATTTITVFNAAVTAGPFGPFCQGDGAQTLTGSPVPSGGATGTWSGTGITSVNSTTGTATFDPALVTGNTTLTYTFDANNCTKTASTNVVVNSGATVSVAATNTQVCAGASITLTATATNQNGLLWATSGSGTFSNPTGTTTTYTPTGSITGTSRTDEISIIANSVSTNCPVAIASVDIQVIQPASVSLGDDISFCNDLEGIVSPIALGSGNTVVWSSSNGTFSSPTAESPTYTPTLPLGSFTRTDVLTITASDAFGFCPTATDQVNVTLLDVITISEGATSTICEGDTVLLTDNYTGPTTGFTSEVSGDNGQVIVENSQIIYVPNENTGETIRTDEVILINLDLDGSGPCVAVQDTMMVSVHPKATVDLIADTAICAGETLDLLVTATGIPNLSSTFSNAINSYPSTQPTIGTVALLDTVIYETQIAGSICPAAKDSVVVTFNPNSTTALAVADADVCETSTVELDAVVTGVTYTWDVVGNTGTLSDSTIQKPVYTPNPTTTADRVDTLVLNVTSTTDRCNTGIDTALVRVLRVGSYTEIPDTLICADNTLALDLAIDGSYDTFTWSTPNGGSFSSTSDTNAVYTPLPLTTGTRMDTIIGEIVFANAACPTVEDTIVVTVLGGIEVMAGADATICQDFGYTLNGALGNGATSATWSVIGGFGTFDDASQLDAVYTPSSTNGTTRVDLLVLTSNDPDGTGGCTPATDTIEIIVTPAASVSLGADMSLFEGQSITLTATTTEPVNSSQWSSDITSLSGSGLTQTTFTATDLGTATSRIDRVIYEGFFSNESCASAKDTINIKIEKPTAIRKVEDVDFCGSLCLEEQMLNLDRNTGTVVILANNVNPFDTCGVNSAFDFKFWESTMTMAEPNTVLDLPSLPATITLDCSDKGIQMLNVYVTDIDGNTQLCPVEVNLLDEGLVCGERTVSGTIRTRSGEPMEGVEVFAQEISEVGGVVPDPVKTDVNGQYTFNLKTDKRYRIVPSRDTDITEGVTAFDNVVISRHILGLQVFDSPYQTIAADVNKSGTVTAFDIVIIRKVVLAREGGTFEGNTSWRFVDADYVFENVADAASAPFQESFEVTELMGNVTDMDFIGVKVGDPNNTALPNGDGLKAIAEDRNTNNNRLLETNNLSIEKGQVYEVPFRFIDGKEISSYQFTMDYDGLELLDIQGGIATPEHFGQTMTKRSLLTAAWSAAEPVAGDQTWFTLKFKANKSGVLSEMVSLNSVVTPIEAVTTDEENVGIQLTFVQSNATALALFQNKPNPFKDETTVGFALPASGTADITVLDMQGRVLKTIQGDYAAGYNEVQINFADLPRGVFYYRLETAFGTRVQKMMRVE